MKKLFAIMALAVCAGLCACNDDDDYSWPVPQPVVKTLYDMYPAAYHISWHREGDYPVAEFRTTQNNVARDHRAWFDNAGTWYMTETETPLLQMPRAVQEAFALSSYTSWRFDGGDLLERAGMSDIYAIRVEGERTRSREDEAVLYFLTDGTLVKTLLNPGDDYHYSDMLPARLPAAVSSFIQSKYPAAHLVATSSGQNVTRVEILDSGVLRTVWFNGSNDWLYTATPIAADTLPEAVTAALAASAYAGYTVQESLFCDTPTGDRYRLTLQSGTQSVKVDITPDGTLSTVNE